jgi:hypothetical protein
MLDTLTLFLFPLVGVIAGLTAAHIYKSFETPLAVMHVVVLPVGLAQVLTSFGAHSALGGFASLFQWSGGFTMLYGLGALVYVAKSLNGRGLTPRTTPLPVAKED